MAIIITVGKQKLEINPDSVRSSLSYYRTGGLVTNSHPDRFKGFYWFLNVSVYLRITDLTAQLYFYVELPEDPWECSYLNDLDDYAGKRKNRVNVLAAH